MKRKILRYKKTLTKEKKNYTNLFLSLLITSALILCIFLVVYFVDPNTYGAIPFFFFLFSITIFSCLSIFMRTMRRKLLITTGISLFLFLRYIRMGNIINLMLIIGFGIVYEWYSQKSN